MNKIKCKISSAEEFERICKELIAYQRKHFIKYQKIERRIKLHKLWSQK